MSEEILIADTPAENDHAEESRESKDIPEAAPANRRSRWIIFAVVFVVIAQLAYTIFCYVDKKEGFFGDEIWGYGLANSYYKPFIYLKKGISIDDIDNYEIDNMDEWVDGKVFEDYITVQPDERFAYGSVIYNQSYDHHPPFYYMVLHTVCSLFPDSFSFLYGFVLNCIFLVVNTVFLFLLARLMLNDDKKALVTTILYACSTGALSTFIYIRQYSLFTTMLTMTLYFTAVMFYKEKREGGCKLVKTIPPIAITSFLTFFSHYYGIVFLGVFTAVICFWLLFHKRIKTMFVYGGSVLAALVLFFIVYPASIDQALFSVNSKAEEGYHFSLPFIGNIRFSFSHTLRYSVGLSVSVMEDSKKYYVIAAFVLLLGLCLPLCFLFRNEKWFKALDILGHSKKKGLEILGKIRHFDGFLFAGIAAMSANIVVLATQVDMMYYLHTASRYVFHLMPIACVLVVTLANEVIELLPFFRRHIVPVISVLAVAGIVRMNIMWPCKYYFREAGKEGEVRAALEGKNVLLVIADSLTPNLLSSFPSYVGKANKVFPTMTDDFDKNYEKIKDEHIDNIIILSRSYVLTEEQYEKIEALYEKYGKEKWGGFVMEDDEDTSEEPEEETEEDELPEDDDLRKLNEKMNQRISEKLYELCPKEDFMPEYVIDVNNGDFIVFERVNG